MFLLNIHLRQQLTKCCVFLFFFSILLNAYDTPVERAERATSDRTDSAIGSKVWVMWVSKMRVYIHAHQQ